MKTVGLMGRGRGNNGQVLIAATSKQSGEEWALHPGPRGVRGRWSQLLRGLSTDGKLVHLALCMR